MVAGARHDLIFSSEKQIILSTIGEMVIGGEDWNEGNEEVSSAVQVEGDGGIDQGGRHGLERDGLIQGMFWR